MLKIQSILPYMLNGLLTCRIYSIEKFLHPTLNDGHSQLALLLTLFFSSFPTCASSLWEKKIIHIAIKKEKKILRRSPICIFLPQQNRTKTEPYACKVRQRLQKASENDALHRSMSEKTAPDVTYCSPKPPGCSE